MKRGMPSRPNQSASSGQSVAKTVRARRWISNRARLHHEIQKPVWPDGRNELDEPPSATTVDIMQPSYRHGDAWHDRCGKADDPDEDRDAGAHHSIDDRRDNPEGNGI